MQTKNGVHCKVFSAHYEMLAILKTLKQFFTIWILIFEPFENIFS